MAKLSKRATIRWNNEVLRTSVTSFDPGYVTRTEKPNDQEGIDFTEETRPSRLSVTVHHAADTDVESIMRQTGVSVNVEFDSGVQYVIPGAFLVEPGEISDGEWPIVIAGNPAQRLA